MRGPEGLNRFAAMYRCVFPDIAMDVRDQLAEGDFVGTRFVARGTHRGAPMGIPPPGNRVEIDAFKLHRFSGAKITEDWVEYDALGIVQQIGAVPPPGRAAGR